MDIYNRDTDKYVDMDTYVDLARAAWTSAPRTLTSCPNDPNPNLFLERKHPAPITLPQ